MISIRLGSLLFLLAALTGRPAVAQTDLSGVWQPVYHEDRIERIPGPSLGDYAGLPISDAARFHAETWDASLLTLPEHQCKPHPSTYGFRGVGNLRVRYDWDDTTQELITIETHIQWQEQKRIIWMDGREHPPDHAPHTWQGFSTGRWEGNVLAVRTTHLKQGWIRRNGLIISDLATMEERFFRHGDILTHVYMISDPVYLTEPLIRTNGFRLNLNASIDPYPCEAVDEVPRPLGEVPHHLPGQNPFLNEYAEEHGLAIEAVRGGAETALPEFMRPPAAGAVDDGGRAVGQRRCRRCPVSARAGQRLDARRCRRQRDRAGGRRRGAGCRHPVRVDGRRAHRRDLVDRR